jgi:uncharacterized OsmC-like protein
MLQHFPEFEDQVQAAQALKMKERHGPLCEQYIEDPEAAIIGDGARTSSKHVDAKTPIYTEAIFGKNIEIGMPVGIHTAVGGECDYPNPGDILCGAIAACLDSTIRVVANRVGVRLKELSVEVNGMVDVRGTLRVGRNVPVGFQKFDIDVSIKAAGLVPKMILNKIVKGAESSCVVLQTLRNPPEISLTTNKS